MKFLKVTFLILVIAASMGSKNKLCESVNLEVENTPEQQWTSQQLAGMIAKLTIDKVVLPIPALTERVRKGTQILSLTESNGQVYIGLTKPVPFDVSLIFEQINIKANFNRINIIQKTEAAYDNISIQKEKFFAWYSLSKQVPSANVPVASTNLESLKSSGIVVEKHEKQLPKPVTKMLLKEWEKDYLAKALAGYPDKLVNEQRRSFESQLQTSTHMIFRKDGKIIAHCSIKRFFHPLFNQDASAAHQWVSLDLGRETRKIIHEYYFSRLYEERRLIVAGIGEPNSRSLQHFLKNGFSVDYLAIKRIED